jgi:hypothetical protein
MRGNALARSMSGSPRSASTLFSPSSITRRNLSLILIERSAALRRSSNFAIDSSARSCRFKSRASSAEVLSATLPACTSGIKRASVSRTAIALSNAGSGSKPSVTTWFLLLPPFRPSSEALAGLA